MNGNDEEDDDESNVAHNSDYDDPPVKLRRNQYTMDVMQSWYDSKFSNESNESKPQLAIIMPNFEEFKPTIIKDLIQILRFVLQTYIKLSCLIKNLMHIYFYMDFQ